MTGGPPDPQLEAYVAAVEAAMATTDAALAELRRYVGAGPKAEPVRPPTIPSEPERRPDLIGLEWIEISTAAKRFGKSKELIRSWCQRDECFAWKHGGGWLVSISKTKARLGIR
ncbi:hypothetical protein [Mesorhizobium argentiipisi]|uniref:DNA-binding protein n=1 Tax=Mesorhizobium argentiipisi TaxID=3015175 RepID=A0ABU8KEM3_9HYPH